MATDETMRPPGELLVYQEQGLHAPIQVRLEGETVWLTQKQMAELYGVAVSTLNEHITHIFDDDELKPDATIRKFRIVQTEGNRQVKRLLDHYNLDMILAVGFRVRSRRGSQFRQWAFTQQAATQLRNSLLPHCLPSHGGDADAARAFSLSRWRERAGERVDGVHGKTAKNIRKVARMRGSGFWRCGTLSPNPSPSRGRGELMPARMGTIEANLEELGYGE